MKIIKKIHPFEIALIAVVVCIHVYAAFSDAYNLPNTWFSRDDAYYYFKVAQNISEGHGSTFDGINLTNGYHPLWMLVCVPIFALARFNLILPLRVLLLVMAFLDAITAVLIYRLVKANLSHSVAILAASFWAFNSYIHYIVYEFGLETPLAAFAVVLFIYKLSHFEKSWRSRAPTMRELALLAGLAVLVTFSRLDLIFLAVIAGVWIIFRGSRLRYLLPFDVVAVFVAMTTSIALRAGLPEFNMHFAAAALRMAALAIVVKVPLLYAMGAYRQPASTPWWTLVGLSAAALSIGEVILAALGSIGLFAGFPRTALIFDLGICVALVAGLRVAANILGRARPAKGPIESSPLNEARGNWRRWVRESSVYYGILLGALAAYMLWNKIMFGTFTPVSGQIKRWWGTLGATVYEGAPRNWSSFFAVGFRGEYDAWPPTSNFFLSVAERIKPFYPGSNTLDERYFIVMAVCVVIALALLFAQPRHTTRKFSDMALIPLISGGLLQMFAYTTTGYGGPKEWYWVSQMVMLVLIEAVLLDGILGAFSSIVQARRVLEIAALAGGAYLAFALATEVRSSMRYNYFAADRPSLEVLPYLEQNTPAGSIIGMTGGGNVAYFIHDRTIVNMDGLINSFDYFRALQQGNAPRFLRERGVTIVFASPRLLAPPPYFGQFAPWLENYSVYGGKDLMYLLDAPKY